MATDTQAAQSRVVSFFWRTSAEQNNPAEWKRDSEEWTSGTIGALRTRIARDRNKDLDQAADHAPQLWLCDEEGRLAAQPATIDAAALLEWIPTTPEAQPLFRRYSQGKPHAVLLFTFPPATATSAPAPAPAPASSDATSAKLDQVVEILHQVAILQGEDRKEVRKLRKEQQLAEAFRQAHNNIATALLVAHSARRRVSEFSSLSSNNKLAYNMKTRFAVKFSPLQLHVPEDSDAVRLAFAVGKKEGGRERASVDPAIKQALDALQQQASVPANQMKAFKVHSANGKTNGVENWKGATSDSESLNFKHAQLLSNNSQQYNPDFVLTQELGQYATVLMVIDAKSYKGKSKGHSFDDEDVGKAVRDAAYCARLCGEKHMPFLVWSPVSVLAGEVFCETNLEADDVVLLFPQWDPSSTEGAMKTMGVVAYATQHGTLLGTPGSVNSSSDIPSGSSSVVPSNSDNIPRFTRLLGVGLTSLVFQTTLNDWPVAKVIVRGVGGKTPSQLAKHEHEALNAINTMLDEKQVPEERRHFLRSTLPNSEAQAVGIESTADNPAAVIFFDKVCKRINDNTQLAQRDMIEQALEACDQMREAGVVHNDLRESNLLLYKPESKSASEGKNRLIIADFGFSVRGPFKPIRWLGGTIATAHPEVLGAASSSESESQTEYTPRPAHDWFSIVTLCRMAQLCKQIGGRPIVEQLRKCHNFFQINAPNSCEAVGLFWEWQLFHQQWHDAAAAANKESNAINLLGTLINALNSTTTGPNW